MTDKEKLNAIRAEVQNYIDSAHKAHTNITEGNFAHLLSFIDSLQEVPVSEELEKAAEQDVCEVVNNCSATGIPNDHIPSWVQDAMIKEFIHGANWQKQQMMKDAVEGEITKISPNDYLRAMSDVLPLKTNQNGEQE